jgi:hypothetical protein
MRARAGFIVVAAIAGTGAIVTVGLAGCGGSSRPSDLYDANATRQCLTERPEYVPNASSPSTKPQMLVAEVFRTKRDRTQGPEFIPRGTSVVGVTFTPAHTLRQDLASLSFFPSEQSARDLYAVDAVVRKRFPKLFEQQRRNLVVVWTPLLATVLRFDQSSSAVSEPPVTRDRPNCRERPGG